MKDIWTCDDISVLVDNNILCDLFELNQMDLLFDSFSCVKIPLDIYNDEIVEEIKTEVNKYKYATAVMETEHGYEVYSKINDQYKGLSKYDKYIIF